MLSVVVFWILLAGAVGIAAAGRGRNGFGWFLISLIVSPLIGGFLVVALPSAPALAEQRERIDADRNSRHCPQCAEPIRMQAVVCKHCGAPQSQQDIQAAIAHRERTGRQQRNASRLKAALVIVALLCIAYAMQRPQSPAEPQTAGQGAAVEHTATVTLPLPPARPTR